MLLSIFIVSVGCRRQGIRYLVYDVHCGGEHRLGFLDVAAKVWLSGVAVGLGLWR